MIDVQWNKIFQESPVKWLLEENNPSVRYFTLRDILDRGSHDTEVITARLAIPQSESIVKILSKQRPEGYWENPQSPYHPKYKSSYWQIMTLAQLGMDRTDERARKACEHIFQYQLEDGGFSSYTQEGAIHEHKPLIQKGKHPSLTREWASSLVFEHQYSCLTGNIATALLRMGYANDPRAKKSLDWLVRIQNRDGGWLCPYWRAHIKDKHGCFYGTICPLETFSEVGEENLTIEMKEAATKAAEFLLIHRLFKADHHDFKIVNIHWLELGFPFYYGYSILRALDVLTRLGYAGDERLNDAVEVLLQKRQKDGTWILETSPVGRMHANLEAKGKRSKWITLIALRVLKRLG